MHLASRRTKVISVCVFAAVMAIAVTARPLSAFAGWLLADHGPVALGFGSTYTAADGTSSVHRGADLAAEAGARVSAPLAGTVVFVGRVPSVGGGTALAVTISSARGTFTLMPLESSSVSKGDDLAENAEVGTVAASGDGSCATTHLHVGLRVNGLYVDPLPSMAVATPPSSGDTGSGSGAAAESAVIVGSAAGAGVGAGTGVVAHRTASGARAAAGRSSAAVAAAAPQPLGAAMAGAALAPGVSVAGGPLVVPVAASQVAPVPASAAAPAAAVSPPVATSAGSAALVSHALRAASRAGRAGGRLAAGILVALGCMWPLWRRKKEGAGEVSVRPLGDDVAAVAGR